MTGNIQRRRRSVDLGKVSVLAEEKPEEPQKLTSSSFEKPSGPPLLPAEAPPFLKKNAQSSSDPDDPFALKGVSEGPSLPKNRHNTIGSKKGMNATIAQLNKV